MNFALGPTSRIRGHLLPVGLLGWYWTRPGQIQHQVYSFQRLSSMPSTSKRSNEMDAMFKCDPCAVLLRMPMYFTALHTQARWLRFLRDMRPRFLSDNQKYY